jgi:alpha-L-rhamnosidase
VEDAGSFSCSNPMFNRLREVTDWTFRSNMFSVQSDCPHREKLGYGGDIVATSEAFIAHFDMALFYEKAVRDLADAARPNGGMTETAPYVGIADEGFGGGSGPIGWGTAYPLLQWNLYRYYGNRALLEEQYETTKRWLTFLEASVKDNIVRVGISDHESLAPKPVALTGTAFYYYNAHLMSKIAGALGKAEDEERYTRKAEEIKETFNREFLKAGTGPYDSGTQASQAFALYFGLVPPGEEGAALDHLVKDVTETHKGHLTTGIFGTKYLLNVLSDRGRADVAYGVADQRTFPGWGHMLERGATTLWEHWEFSDNTFSHNHPMFGSVSEWFTSSLAGIRPDPDAVGYDRVRIQPETVDGLQWTKGEYRSVRGRIASEWRREGGEASFRISLPVGVTGIASLPVSEGDTLRFDGPADGPESGAAFVERRNGRAVFRLGSGEYRFTRMSAPRTGA